MYIDNVYDVYVRAGGKARTVIGVVVACTDTLVVVRSTVTGGGGAGSRNRTALAGVRHGGTTGTDNIE